MDKREAIRKIGIRNFIIYHIIRYLEILINLPYKILKRIITIIYCIFDYLNDVFYKDDIIIISKLSKKANDFRIKILKMVRE